MVGEMSTSKHDVDQMRIFLNVIKSSYFKYTREKLVFRLIVIDYSWASVHAILSALNEEDVIQYANRVFSLLNGEITIESSEKSWLASCAAHTMHRFTKSISKNPKNNKSVLHFLLLLF